MKKREINCSDFQIHGTATQSCLLEIALLKNNNSDAVHCELRGPHIFYKWLQLPQILSLITTSTNLV